MGNAPSLGNIELEHRNQFSARLPRHGIAPGAERSQQFARCVKWHISVHHARKSHGSQLCNLHTILLPHILRKTLITALKSLPYIFQAIGPDVIFQSILPVPGTHGNGLMIFIHQHCLNAGRTKFQSQNRLPAPDDFLNRFLHYPFPSFLRRLSYTAMGYNAIVTTGL